MNAAVAPAPPRPRVAARGLRSISPPPSLAAASPRLTAADLVERFGPIPLDRVCWQPFPGTATFEDAVRLNEAGGLYEFIDGILLEKPLGFIESEIATRLAGRVTLWDPAERRGRRTGEAGFVRLRGGRLRAPDYSFFEWARFPDPAAPLAAYPELTPDFCVEILSDSNTREEIDGKLDDLFASGCRLAWVIDPRARTARIVTPAADETPAADGAERPWIETVADESATLTGDPVLPGFAVRLADLLATPEPPPDPATAGDVTAG